MGDINTIIERCKGQAQDVIERLSRLIDDLEAVGMSGGAEVAKLASDTIAAMAFCLCDPDFVRKS